MKETTETTEEHKKKTKTEIAHASKTSVSRKLAPRRSVAWRGTAVCMCTDGYVLHMTIDDEKIRV